VHIVAATRNLAHGGHYLFVRCLLEHVAARACCKGFANVTGVVLHREYEHLRVRRLLQQLRQHLDAALAGHDNVQQHHIGLQGACTKDRVLRVACFADHLDVLLLVE
jgi:hypothetical protein